ncbi:MAG TPA: anti-sigma factor [Cytophagaceae bacterium]|jgi:anti-sigma-K factor RskA|nr:anti-sigma factor [Cytophagaceae bacterium]
MSTEEYIASGILEAYVLGGLNAKEVQEVEHMESIHPEVKREIFSLQKAFESYAEYVAVKPPVELKNKILSQLSDSSSDIEDTKTTNVFYYNYVTAAAVALMIVCGSMSLYFWSKWRSTEQQLMVLEEQTNRYADQIKKANYRASQLAEDFDLIRDVSVVKVNMKGAAISPDSRAVVFWNKSTSEVFVDAGNLPKAPEGMQYQLWALKDGQPIDAGVFESDFLSGLQKAKFIQGAQAYAVTLEKRGGSVTPTLSAMYVFGEV